jgi:hypothetical protein
MIVIPPTLESEEYVTRVAKESWTNYTLRDPDIEGELQRGKTLVITCELEVGDKTMCIKLHYRYLRDLYCFVEEI